MAYTWNTRAGIILIQALLVTTGIRIRLIPDYTILRTTLKKNMSKIAKIYIFPDEKTNTHR